MKVLLLFLISFSLQARMRAGIHCEPNNIVQGAKASIEVACTFPENNGSGGRINGYLKDDVVMPEFSVSLYSKSYREYQVIKMQNTSESSIATIIEAMRNGEEGIRGLMETNTSYVDVDANDLDFERPANLEGFSDLQYQADFKVYRDSGANEVGKEFKKMVSKRAAGIKVNERFFQKEMELQDKCIKGPGKDSEEIKALYEALVTLKTARKCPGIDKMRDKETGRSRGVSFGPKVTCAVRISEATDIGFGYINVETSSGTKKLNWNANHLTNMSVEDWLNGKKSHAGFKVQAQEQGICDFDLDVPKPDCEYVGNARITRFDPGLYNASASLNGRPQVSRGTNLFVCQVEMQCQKVPAEFAGLFQANQPVPILCSHHSQTCPSDPVECAKDETFNSGSLQDAANNSLPLQDTNPKSTIGR